MAARIGLVKIARHGRRLPRRHVGHAGQRRPRLLSVVPSTTRSGRARRPRSCARATATSSATVSRHDSHISAPVTLIDARKTPRTEGRNGHTHPHLVPAPRSTSGPDRDAASSQTASDERATGASSRTPQLRRPARTRPASPCTRGTHRHRSRRPQTDTRSCRCPRTPRTRL